LVNHASFGHFNVKVITLTSPLTHTGKNGISTVTFSNVVNELHDDHGLTHTSTTEGTHFTTFGKRANEVDDFNTCLK